MIRFQAVLQILLLPIPIAENANSYPRLPQTAHFIGGRTVSFRLSADTEANAAVAAMEKMTNDGTSS